jgi:hypothetical protein
MPYEICSSSLSKAGRRWRHEPRPRCHDTAVVRSDYKRAGVASRRRTRSRLRDERNSFCGAQGLSRRCSCMAHLPHSYLYLLAFPERGLLKIGKADNVHSRIQQLRQDWGAVDYGRSHQLHEPTHRVFALEKALLSFLSEYRTPQKFPGVGATEVVSIAALQPALRHLQIVAPGRVHKVPPRPVPRLMQAVPPRATADPWGLLARTQQRINRLDAVFAAHRASHPITPEVRATMARHAVIFCKELFDATLASVEEGLNAREAYAAARVNCAEPPMDCIRKSIIKAAGKYLLDFLGTRLGGLDNEWLALRLYGEHVDRCMEPTRALRMAARRAARLAPETGSPTPSL